MTNIEKILCDYNRHEYEKIFYWLFDENIHAKPHISLREHTADTVENGNVLHRLGYIDDNTHEFLLTAALFHDSGKANDKFQKRLRSAEQGQRKDFDPAEEIPHQIISAAHWCGIVEYLKHLGVTFADDAVNMIFYAIWKHHARQRCSPMTQISHVP